MQKVLFMLLSLAFISCSNNRKRQISTEGICEDRKEQASTDIRNEKIIYCNVIDPMVPPIKYKAEMTDLLLRQNIIVQDLRSYREPGSCYCEYMKNEIGKRFGPYYLDSLNQLSAEIFFLKHANDTIDHADCDTYPAYPGTTGKESDELFQSRFNTLVKYPKGYRYRNSSSSRDVIFVSLVVEKTGEIRIDKFIPIIRNTKNIQFTEYLEDQVRHILPHSGWRPATIANHPVHSDMSISVFLN